jgi:hypothetical protein
MPPPKSRRQKVRAVCVSYFPKTRRCSSCRATATTHSSSAPRKGSSPITPIRSLSTTVPNAAAWREPRRRGSAATAATTGTVSLQTNLVAAVRGSVALADSMARPIVHKLPACHHRRQRPGAAQNLLIQRIVLQRIRRHIILRRMRRHKPVAQLFHVIVFVR